MLKLNGSLLNSMDKCLICGSTNFSEENVNEIYDINGEPVLVRNIPTSVCKNCGEKYFTGKTHEKVMQLIYNNEIMPETFTVKSYRFL